MKTKVEKIVERLFSSDSSKRMLGVSTLAYALAEGKLSLEDMIDLRVKLAECENSKILSEEYTYRRAIRDFLAYYCDAKGDLEHKINKAIIELTEDVDLGSG